MVKLLLDVKTLQVFGEHFKHDAVRMELMARCLSTKGERLTRVKNLKARAELGLLINSLYPKPAYIPRHTQSVPFRTPLRTASC